MMLVSSPSLAELDAEAVRILSKVLPPEWGMPNTTRGRWLAVEFCARLSEDVKMEQHAANARQMLDAMNVR